jgi:hypothetical protein
VNDWTWRWKDRIWGRASDRIGGKGAAAACDAVGHLLMLMASRGSANLPSALGEVSHSQSRCHAFVWEMRWRWEAGGRGFYPYELAGL